MLSLEPGRHPANKQKKKYAATHLFNKHLYEFYISYTNKEGYPSDITHSSQ